MVNGKVTIKDVYELIVPIKEDIATVKEKMSNVNRCVEDIKEENKNLRKFINSKISVKAFILWLTSLSVIIGIVLAIVLR